MTLYDHLTPRFSGGSGVGTGQLSMQGGSNAVHGKDTENSVEIYPTVLKETTSKTNG